MNRAKKRSKFLYCRNSDASSVMAEVAEKEEMVVWRWAASMIRYIYIVQ